MVETQPCKLRDRSEGVLIICFVYNVYGVCELNPRQGFVDTQFHRFYGRPFARVLYLIRMKDIGRWLPWLLPGSSGRFSIITIMYADTV